MTRAMELEEKVSKMINNEIDYAYKRYGAFHSPHELWGVLKEEEEEFWNSIKDDNEDLYELLQVCAVGLLYIEQRCSENPKQLTTIAHKQKRRCPK